MDSVQRHRTPQAARQKTHQRTASTVVNLQSTITGSNPARSVDKVDPGKLDVKSIGFSQSSVSNTFSDGRSLQETTNELILRRITASDIPPIRVVKYNGNWITLDNRRLRVFLDALITSVPVIVCHLKDPQIAKEFWDKKSNKSLAMGGVVRDMSSSSQQHFTEGIFVFNKRVLNWNVSQICSPMPHEKKVKIPCIFNDRRCYYESFQELIFEEARAILQTGIEAIGIPSLTLSLEKFKASKNPENPTEMRFKILKNEHHELRAGDAFLLVYQNLYYIALANYSETDLFEMKFSLKVVIDQSHQYSHASAFQDQAEWQAKPIGSLITLQRMFDACTSYDNRRETRLERMLWYGRESCSIKCVPLTAVEQGLLAQLNASQAQAVKEFLQIKKGVKLVQGPPGTGKTTTVDKLLRILVLRGERVLVSAPSNKAVQILAERFLNENPDVPIILIGVEKKLPASGSLHRIFFDLWAERQLGALERLGADLADFKINELITGDHKFFRQRIQAACQKLQNKAEELASLYKEIYIYRLSCFNDLYGTVTKMLESIEGYKNFLSTTEFNTYTDTQGRIALSQLYKQFSTLHTSLKNAAEDSSPKGLEMELLNHSRVIFATLSITGQQRLKTMDDVDTLIIDEAGQAVEAETLIPLRTSPKKCLLIGDIQQLPATVISQDAVKLNFGRSLMERLTPCYKSSMLNIQYRMRPEICQFPSQAFYNGQLQNAPTTFTKDLDLPSFLAPYAFINVDGQEKKGPHDQSFLNRAEAKYVKTIISYLHKQSIDVNRRVGVITFYKAQADLIRDNLKSEFPGILVNTVDGFQGGENDFILISCVRANFDQRIGFVGDEKRLNVALTRAKLSLVILGNEKTLAKGDLAALVKDAKQRHVFYKEDVFEKLFIRNDPPPQKPQVAPSPKKPKQQFSQKLDATNQKTQLCRHYLKPNGCWRGDRCAFAHGDVELRK